jgi:hypothetical protein
LHNRSNRIPADFQSGIQDMLSLFIGDASGVDQGANKAGCATKQNETEAENVSLLTIEIPRNQTKSVAQCRVSRQISP